MTDQEINLRMAKIYGFHDVVDVVDICGTPRMTGICDGLAVDVPDFAQCLDSVHLFWVTLTITQHVLFRRHLNLIVERDGHTHGPCRSVSNASARQRCEAILKVYGQWGE